MLDAPSIIDEIQMKELCLKSTTKLYDNQN